MANNGFTVADRNMVESAEKAKGSPDNGSSSYHARVAAYHGEWRDHWSRSVNYYDCLRIKYQKLADWHARLALKYTHAADRPWLSVPPAPPQPPDPLSDGDLARIPLPPEMRFDF